MSSSFPIDPHEEKWSKFVPNPGLTDGKNMNKEFESKMNDYITFSKTNNATANSFQNQSFKEFTKQDDLMKIFSDRLVKQMEDMQKTKNFMAMNNLRDTMQLTQNKLIISPEQISPLVKGYEDRITSFEYEINNREKDFLKMMAMIDLLIEENKYLRDHIAFKNKDIARILETIGLNDGETVHDLRHRLNLLTEENNLLLSHLEDLKSVKENANRFNKDKHNEIIQIQESYTNIKRDLEDALRREEALANFKQMIEPKYHQAQQKIAETEAKLEQMTEEIIQLKNTNLLISNQLNHYKKNIDELDTKKTLEIEKLIQELTITQNEIKELKKINENKDKNIEIVDDQGRKLRKELEHMKLEYEEAIQFMNDLKNQLANEKQRVEIAQKKEKDQRERADKAIIELDKANSKCHSLEIQHRKSLDTLSSEYEAKVAKLEASNESLKSTKSEIIKEKENEIQSLTKQINDMKKIIERMREEKMQLNNQLNSMQSNEAEEIYEKNRFIKELENEINRLNQNLKDAENVRKEDIKKLQIQNDDLRKESIKLNETNKQLLNDINFFKSKYNANNISKNSPLFIKDHQNYEETQKIIHMLQEENNKLQSEINVLNQGNIQEISNENKYLHEIIKNMAKHEELKPYQSQYFNSDNRYDDSIQQNGYIDQKATLPKNFRGIGASQTVNNTTKKQTELIHNVGFKSNSRTSPSKNIDVDLVVDNILKKYNLNSLPQPNEIPQKLLGKDNLIQNSSGPFQNTLDNSPTKMEIIEQNVSNNSNLNYLSPLLSTDRMEKTYGVRYLNNGA